MRQPSIVFESDCKSGRVRNARRVNEKSFPDSGLPASSTDVHPTEPIRAEILAITPSAGKRLYQKFFLAALGSIPWVGGFLSTMATLKTEAADGRADDLRTQWLNEHQKKIEQLTAALKEIVARFDQLGPEIDERIQSEGYLQIVRRAFRTWDQADTDEKRRYVANLVSNAGGTRLCSDDILRLFIDWLNLYHEVHFAVFREIHKQPGASRFDIWSDLYGDVPREDSADADLFKLLGVNIIVFEEFG